MFSEFLVIPSLFKEVERWPTVGLQNLYVIIIYFSVKAQCMIRSSLGSWVLDSDCLWTGSPLVPANVDLCHVSFSSYAMGASLNALLTSKLKIQCVSFAYKFWGELLRSLMFITKTQFCFCIKLFEERLGIQLVNWILKAKREALPWFYACFEEVLYIVTMLRKSENGLPKNMLTVKKIRLEQGSAELVELNLTSCR